MRKRQSDWNEINILVSVYKLEKCCICDHRDLEVAVSLIYYFCLL